MIFNNLNKSNNYLTMDCNICYENIPDCTLVCGHMFCKQCVFEWWYANKENVTTCPYCRCVLEIKSPDKHIREIRIDHKIEYDIYKIYNDIMKFHKNKIKFSKKYEISFDEIKYLSSKPWTKSILLCENGKSKENFAFTKYTFINNKDDTSLKQLVLKHDDI